MSGNNFGYYYAGNSQNYPVDPSQSCYWPVDQQQQQQQQQPQQTQQTQQQYGDGYNRNNLQYSNNSLNHSTNHGQRSQNFYHPTNNRHFPNRRFNPASTGQPNWMNRNNFKRPRSQDGMIDEPKTKTTKKKKKPLSQNIPSRKDWTEQDAERALAIEKEYNKRYKNHSLIIKFPDLELNRDIVTKFHTAIENVHFQQPSTPRFCFVTLQENADADDVIKQLNEIKFGDGYLQAEYKKDREEDQNIGPGDIDPCTLYVGNLAQEITKEDMVKTYPKGRRIDIGYAKKMKYTRYAFVSFKNVNDSIEAFKKTHSTQMYSKSLIVRFRRLHGTVGMPGESKQQSPQKNKSTNQQLQQSQHQIEQPQQQLQLQQKDCNSTQENVGICKKLEPDLSLVKKEKHSSDDDDDDEDDEDDDDDDEDDELKSPFMAGSVDIALAQHKPIIKQEIKTERDNETVEESNSNNRLESIVKTEPEQDEDSSDGDDYDADLGDVNFGNLLNQIEDHSNQIESLRKSSVL